MLSILLVYDQQSKLDRFKQILDLKKITYQKETQTSFKVQQINTHSITLFNLTPQDFPLYQRIKTELSIQQTAFKIIFTTPHDPGHPSDTKAFLEDPIQPTLPIVLNAVPQAIIVINTAHDITLINQAAHYLLNHHDLNPLTNRSFFSLMPDTSILSTSKLNNILDKKEIVHFKALNFQTGHQKMIPLSCLIIPLSTPEPLKPIGAVLYLSDSLSSLNNQVLFSEMQNKIQRNNHTIQHLNQLSYAGKMMAAFAHEIAQPLTAIQNYTYLISQSNQLGLNNPLIKALNHESERANQLLLSMTALIKKPQKAYSHINLNQLIHDVVLKTTQKPHNPAIHISLNLIENLPLIEVNSLQIEQVLLNLIRNAIEAMNKNTQAISSIEINTQTTHQTVSMTIIDQGSGIKNEQIPYLFQAFNSTKPNGLGLGLAICNTFIQAHQGTIRYEPNPQGGAMFIVSLPITQPKGSEDT